MGDPAPAQRVTQGRHSGETPAKVVQYGTHPAQVIEVYPRRAGAPRGTLVYFHGGSFAVGLPGAVRGETLVMSQRSRGWDVVSVGYRLRGDAPFPAQIDDGAAALRWLRSHGTNTGVETSRLVTVGHSAGGSLAALMGTIANADGHAVKNVPKVTGWASISGRANFSTPDRDGAALRRDWLGNSAVNVHHASYVVWLDANDPPGYVAHGDSDDTVPVANFQQVRQRSLDHGFFANIEFDLVDRSSDRHALPVECRRHVPQGCVNAPAFNAWLDRL